MSRAKKQTAVETNPAENLDPVEVQDSTTTKSDAKRGANIVEQSANEEAINASGELSVIEKVANLFPVPTFDKEAAFAAAVEKFGTPANFDDFLKINAEISDLEKVWKKENSEKIKAVENISFEKFWEAVTAAGLEAEISKGIDNFTTGLIYSTEKKSTIIYHTGQSDTADKFLCGAVEQDNLEGETVGNNYYYHFDENNGLQAYLRAIRTLKYYTDCQNKTNRELEKSNKGIKEWYSYHLIRDLVSFAKCNNLNIQAAYRCIRFDISRIKGDEDD